jgi:hypothetical protein
VNVAGMVLSVAMLALGYVRRRAMGEQTG